MCQPLRTRWAERVVKASGLLFSKAEIDSFKELAKECGIAKWDLGSFTNEA